MKVATTLLDAAPDTIDRGDAAQAFVEGVALGSYQFLAYKSDAKPSKLAPRAGPGPRERQAEGGNGAGRPGRRERRVGA